MWSGVRRPACHAWPMKPPAPRSERGERAPLRKGEGARKTNAGSESRGHTTAQGAQGEAQRGRAEAPRARREAVQPAAHASEHGAAPRMNADWHARHPMPRGATMQQRIQWHLDHQRHCACRPVPLKLQALMARGMKPSREPWRPRKVTLVEE